MSLLTMKAQYTDENKPPKAEAILKQTSSVLKVLRAVEKEHAKTEGRKYVPIPWQVRVFMFSDRAIAEFDVPTFTPELWGIAEQVAGHKLPDVEAPR